MQLLRDLHSFLAVTQAISPVALSAAGNTDSALFDRGSDQAHEIILSADVTAGSVTLAVLHGDAADGSDQAAVDTSADLIGTITPLTADGKIAVGYIGAKKYLTIRATAAGGTVTQVVSAVIIAASQHLVGGT